MKALSVSGGRIDRHVRRTAAINYDNDRLNAVGLVALFAKAP